MSIGSRASAEFLGTFWLVFGGCGSALLAAAFREVGIGRLLEAIVRARRARDVATVSLEANAIARGHGDLTVRTRSTAIALAAGAFWLALACASPIRTEHDASPTAEFARYATYAWIGESPLAAAATGSGGRSEPRRVDEGMIQRAVDAQLEARGYRTAAPDAADLLVGFEVGSEKKVVEEQAPGRATVYTAGDSYGSWYRSAPVRIRTYTEGTLSLAFFERSSHEAVWVGWASKRITGSDEPEPLIREAVARILESFPARR